MSLEKAIKHGKEHRKPYRGSKAFDCSCRNHGSCAYCESDRTLFDKKARLRTEGQEAEWVGFWHMCDPSDVDSAVIDESLEKIGIDPHDFKARRELDL